MSSSDESINTQEDCLDLKLLQERLGFNFKSIDLLQRAVTHSSAIGQANRLDYERLEYLGDAVLDLAVADILLDIHPSAAEGQLSKMRAALVNEDTLSSCAKEFELSEFIRVSKAERFRNGHQRPSIMADVVESIIGAVFKDSGYLAAKGVVKKLLGERLNEPQQNDSKTELQEKLHTLQMQPPVYNLDQVSGPEHEPIFSTSVEVDGKILGRGEGRTKKASQQAAAYNALTFLQQQVEQDNGEADE